MSRTLHYTGQLTVTSCWCGIKLAIPQDLYDYATRHKHSIWCPLGHKFVYGDTLEKKLVEEQRLRLKAEERAAARMELLRAEERSHAATRGHLTRKRNDLSRVKHGVCPCCNRTFRDLARHMAGQHPNYKP